MYAEALAITHLRRWAFVHTYPRSSLFRVQGDLVVVDGSVAIEGGHNGGEGVADVGGNERLFGWDWSRALITDDGSKNSAPFSSLPHHRRTLHTL